MASVLKSRAASFLPPLLLPHAPLARNHHHRTVKYRSANAKLKVEVLRVGKRSGKDAIYDTPIQEYAKRMSHSLAVSERTIKSEATLDTVSEIANRGRGSVILLDEHGSLPRDSVHFSKILFDALEQGDSRLTIVIGASEGLPKEVMQLKGPKIQVVSLSPLTFTHKMVRLFLYEQLYRATEIRANTKYHK